MMKILLSDFGIEKKLQCIESNESRLLYLSNSSSLHMFIKGSHDLPKILRALRDRLINLTL